MVERNNDERVSEQGPLPNVLGDGGGYCNGHAVRGKKKKKT